MIITQTPFRISFFGGGTDFQAFFERYGGSVLSTTFDKYCYVHVRHLPRFFEFRNQLTYRKIEFANTPDEFEHPAVREGMKWLDMHELAITHDADLPSKSGLGSSSSFAVGLLEAFYALEGRYASKEKLAKDAIYLERVLCKEAGGWQDQIAAAYGGFNRIDFSGDGFTVTPLIISPERKQELNERLMLFFTGFVRFSSEISEEQRKTVETKITDLLEMRRLVDDGARILTDKCNLNDFGHLLDYTWKLKRGLTDRISSSAVDDIYSTALRHGALGGKLLGAGGGGFLVLFVPPECQGDVKSALSKLLYVPFKFEDFGTRVMYYAPESYSMSEEENINA
ncbi:MAG: GHMP kinase [Synergistaceae bacterium]|jgi:D-glycero-alpha-D-manno-heptose-7-phosphate kinase|nr:GHMP kinase [Synergistaceae bacterium]